MQGPNWVQARYRYRQKSSAQGLDDTPEAKLLPIHCMGIVNQVVLKYAKLAELLLADSLLAMLVTLPRLSHVSLAGISRKATPVNSGGSTAAERTTFWAGEHEKLTLSYREYALGGLCKHQSAQDLTFTKSPGRFAFVGYTHSALPSGFPVGMEEQESPHRPLGGLCHILP